LLPSPQKNSVFQREPCVIIDKAGTQFLLSGNLSMTAVLVIWLFPYYFVAMDWVLASDSQLDSIPTINSQLMDHNRMKLVS